MQEFEASGSVANTGTGSRREGEQFEALAARFWHAAGEHLQAAGANAIRVRNRKGKEWTRLSVNSRHLYLPAMPGNGQQPAIEQNRWLDLSYNVRDLVATYPGEDQAISRYSPDVGPFQGSKYPDMFSRRSTNFDGAIILEDSGTLVEKILLEYKTAKSTRGRAIDGNAHERLSFQILQYLEIATRYTRCSMAVFANSAFLKYMNKYHVSFHVQAERLANFRWFDLTHACTASEYARFLNSLTGWLLEGTERQRD